MAETNVKYLKIELDTSNGELKVNGLKSSIEGLEKKISSVTKEARSLNSALKDTSSSAGIAGATAQELGRFVSDLPYGLNAVTNNLSQLGSLFGILVVKAGSFRGAISSLWKTMMGPIGVLFAFQAVVAAIEFFSSRTKRAEEAIDSQVKSMLFQIEVIKLLNEELNNSNTSSERKIQIQNTLLRLDKKMSDDLKDFNGNLKEQNELIERRRIVLEKEVEFKEKEKNAEENLAKVRKELEKIRAREAFLREGEFSNANELYQLNIQRKDLELELSNIKEDLINYSEALTKAEENYNIVLGKNTNNLKANTKFLEKRAKALQAINDGILSEQISLLESIEGGTEEEQKSRLDQITAFKLKELEIEGAAAEEKAKQEGLAEVELIAVRNLYAAKREVLLQGHNNSLLGIMKSFNLELNEELKKIGEPTDEESGLVFLNKIFGTDVKTVKEQLSKGAKEVTDGLAAYQKKRQEVEENGNSAVAKLREEDKLAAVYAFQDVSNAVFGVMDASFQREIDLEQDKTNKVNNQLKERLANEQLSADERKKIQNQIGQNDEALRKKQDEIEKKKFKMNKAAGIANATINTYLAATAALKDPALSTFQRIASMVTIIGSGLAQVAMIAKQKFVSSQSGLTSGGAASGGAAQVQAPDFNVVGQSSSNQIASVIQSQMQKPIRTYVVSKDVSTAQEMDRNIVKTASLG